MNYGEGRSDGPDYDEELEEQIEDERQQQYFEYLNTRHNAMVNYFLQDDVEPRHGGSVYGHRMINREREEGHAKLWTDYFSDNPTWDAKCFRRRFRMSKDLFLRITNRVKSHDHYFVQKRDATNKLGLSTLQKVTAAMRMLAYGTPADSVDEYVRIGESTAIECLKKICRAIVEVFGPQYLRTPNATDIARLLKVGEERGFPGMLGSLDCMHWVWKNCPTAWAGQYSGRSGHPTLILEAVASYDLWIWHAYFGLPGSNNDINVLQSSNLFADLAEGKTPPVKYNIQGTEYNVGYYLADGIYPKWSTLVQTISQPQGLKKQHFAMMQEACRKDVERAFGVLQARFAIVRGPSRFWNKDTLHDIMTACIIIHNMIIEGGRENPESVTNLYGTSPHNVNIPENETQRFQQFLSRHRKIRDNQAHYALRDTLIDHLWARKGEASHN